VHKHVLIAAALTAFLLGASAAKADDGCLDFKWDVSKERQVFSTEAAVLKSGTDAASAPSMEPNRLYRIAMVPAASVKFAVPPGRTSNADSYAGLVKLKITQGGVYRVSLELPIWVDVVSGNELANPFDYQGQRSCAAPHKIVIFDLTGPKTYVLQLVGTNAESVRISVTTAPPRVR
jgi:hypothetical protein